MLALYRRALGLRRAEPSLRGGAVTWLDTDACGSSTPATLRLGRQAPGGQRLVVVTNFGDVPTPLPSGDVLVASVDGPLDEMLPGDATAIVAVR